MTSTGTERLADALRGEHAAIYAYGVLGAHLDTTTVQLAVLAESAHRARRDALMQRLTGKDTTPPPAQPAYALPAPVTDPPRCHLAVPAESPHRPRRDALMQRLTGKDTTPPPAEPAYALPAPVTDQASALRLAITIEERCAGLWRQALPDV